MGINISDTEGYTLAEVRSVRASGLSGVGSCILVFVLDLAVGKVRTDTHLLNITLRLDAPGGGQRIIGWGNVDTCQPVSISEHTSNLSIHTLFQFSPHQIQGIEKLRNGGDLKLNVWFSGDVWQESETRQFRDCGEYVISQQEWVTALGQMGFNKTLLFELRMPEVEVEEEEALIDVLDAAKSHLNKGHYNESVGCCRKAIEFVEKYYGDKRLAAKARKKYEEDREEMDAIERILYLREGLKILPT